MLGVRVRPSEQTKQTQVANRKARACGFITATILAVPLLASTSAGAAAPPPNPVPSSPSTQGFVLANFGYDQGWRVNQHPRYLADITGDGRADIIGMGYAGTYTSIAQGNGTCGPVTFALNNFGFDQGWRVDQHPRYLADVTGDGRADIIGMGNAGTYIAVSQGNGTFGPI